MGTNKSQQQIQHTGLKLIGVIALAAMLLPALAGTASAAIWVVADGDVEGLYNAVDNAVSGDTIELAAGGLYTLDAGQLVIIDITLTIEGNGATIDGDGLSRVFYVAETGALTLNDLKVTGGSAQGPGFPDDAGGGIFNDGGALTLNNSNVNNNTAKGNGGGIANLGTLTLNNSSVNHNTASDAGGGIANRGTLTLNNSSVNHNTASNTFSTGGAGGILNQGGLVTLNGSSSVSHNTANRDGGGIWNFSGRALGTVDLYDTSSVNWNTATNGRGGGIFNGNAIVSLHDSSSVNHNTASSLGGGIFNDTIAIVSLNDSSSVNHNTAFSGGGIYNSPGGELDQNGGSVLHNHPNDIAP